MPLFRSKPKVIDAVQYKECEEALPRGVHKDNGGGRYVETIQGQRVPVKPGEWIVDEGDGKHFYPISDEVFNGPRGYEPHANFAAINCLQDSHGPSVGK